MAKNEKENKIALTCEGVKKYAWQLVGIALALLLALDVVLFCKLNNLKAAQAQPAVQRQYVYNVQKLVQSYPALAQIKANFDKQIAELNAKVDEAQKKLESMKDAKAKEEYATVYISSISLQRDQAIAKYRDDLNAFNQKVNQALIDVANENKLPYVLDSKIMMVTTPAVVDVTDEVIKKIK